MGKHGPDVSTTAIIFSNRSISIILVQLYIFLYVLYKTTYTFLSFLYDTDLKLKGNVVWWNEQSWRCGFKSCDLGHITWPIWTLVLIWRRMGVKPVDNCMVCPQFHLRFYRFTASCTEVMQNKTKHAMTLSRQVIEHKFWMGLDGKASKREVALIPFLEEVMILSRGNEIWDAMQRSHEEDNKKNLKEWVWWGEAPGWKGGMCQSRAGGVLKM